MNERRIVRIRVRGRVQGVGFRAFVEDEANMRALDGWVRNRRDGSVEAVAAGSPEAVKGLLDAIYRGPPAARVDNVALENVDETELGNGSGFGILPTA